MLCQRGGVWNHRWRSHHRRRSSTYDGDFRNSNYRCHGGARRRKAFWRQNNNGLPVAFGYWTTRQLKNQRRLVWPATQGSGLLIGTMDWICNSHDAGGFCHSAMCVIHDLDRLCRALRTTLRTKLGSHTRARIFGGDSGRISAGEWRAAAQVRADLQFRQCLSPRGKCGG